MKPTVSTATMEFTKEGRDRIIEELAFILVPKEEFLDIKYKPVAMAISPGTSTKTLGFLMEVAILAIYHFKKTQDEVISLYLKSQLVRVVFALLLHTGEVDKLLENVETVVVKIDPDTGVIDRATIH